MAHGLAFSGARRSLGRGVARELALALLAAAAARAAAQAPLLSSAPRPSFFSGYDYRYGVAEGADLAALVGKPELLLMRVEGFRDEATGERRLKGRGDAHGIFDIPFAAALALLDEPAAAKAYSPRLLVSRAELREGSRSILYMDLGIVFLGIKVGYRFRAEQERDDLGPREVGYRARLLESLDGRLFAMYSSWYIKEVEIEGKRFVYLRTYSAPGLRGPAPGMPAIMRAFTPGELKGLLSALAREARRRSGLE